MEIFDVHRRDIYNFDDYMDLKKPGFGGPKSAELLKDNKGKDVNPNRKLTEYQNVVKRDETFKNQVFNPTYKAMGGDLVHKQDVGENPYNYNDLYNNMGIATVDLGKVHSDKPKYFASNTNEGRCTDFISFVLESAVIDDSEELCEDCGDSECPEGCECEDCKNKSAE